MIQKIDTAENFSWIHKTNTTNVSGNKILILDLMRLTVLFDGILNLINKYSIKLYDYLEKRQSQEMVLSMSKESWKMNKEM